MSKSMRKRLAVQRPPRFVAGFSDGSGQECVRDEQAEGLGKSRSTGQYALGRTVAVTSWGCSCCQGEVGEAEIAMAKRIAQALNVLDVFERITVLRTDLDGGIVIGPEG